MTSARANVGYRHLGWHFASVIPEESDAYPFTVISTSEAVEMAGSWPRKVTFTRDLGPRVISECLIRLRADFFCARLDKVLSVVLHLFD
jgi:hypothetical protein